MTGVTSSALPASSFPPAGTGGWRGVGGEWQDVGEDALRALPDLSAVGQDGLQAPAPLTSVPRLFPPGQVLSSPTEHTAVRSPFRDRAQDTFP